MAFSDDVTISIGRPVNNRARKRGRIRVRAFWLDPRDWNSLGRTLYECDSLSEEQARTEVEDLRRLYPTATVQGEELIGGAS